MPTYEDVGIMLDEIAESLPQEFYYNLNGGIILCPETKTHPELSSDNYLIMGEYVRDRCLGNHICVYYGSFVQSYEFASEAVWRSKLREVLVHEFRHHLEGRAGVRDLEVEDEIFLQKAKAKLAAGTLSLDTKQAG